MILTLPRELKANADQAGNTRWIHLFNRATYYPGTLNELKLTDRDFADQIAHFRASVSDPNGYRIPVDFNHASMGNGAEGEAAGWVEDDEGALETRNNGRELWARVKFNDETAEAIRAGKWRFVSPEWVPSGQGQSGRLLAIALTNRPAFEDLTPIAASRGYLNPFNEEVVMTAAEIAQAVGEAVKTAMNPFVERIDKLESDRLTASKDEEMNKAFNPHIERGAVTLAEVNLAKTAVLGADDFNDALKAQSAIFSKIKSEGKEDGGAGVDRTGTTVVSGDGNGVAFIPKGVPDGEGYDTALAANISQYVDAEVKDGKSRLDALKGARGKFGADRFQKWANQSTVIYPDA